MTSWRAEVEGVQFDVDWSDDEQRVSVRHPVFTGGEWVHDDERHGPNSEDDANQRAWQLIEGARRRLPTLRRMLEEIHLGEGRRTVADLSRALDDLGAMRTVDALSILMRQGFVRSRGKIGPEMTFEAIHADLQKSLAAARDRSLGIEIEI